MEEEKSQVLNSVIIAAWDGVLFKKFYKFRDVIMNGLGAHGTAAMKRIDLTQGQKVIDIGCGFGDGTEELASHTGSAYGVDAAPNFIKYADENYAKKGSVTFDVKDVQADDLGGPYDMAFARFGTMFFDDTTAALKNICNSLKPGARFTMVVWRQKKDNAWLYEAEKVVRSFLEEPESDAPTCGPGPFSMADADDTSRWMQNAGFEHVSLERYDTDIRIGKDAKEAMEFGTAIGPAGEVIRLSGKAAEERIDEIRESIIKAIKPFEKNDGVWMPSSTWFVTGYRPT